MVENIKFPTGLPPLARSKRVKRADRQKEKPARKPFEEYLQQKEKKDERPENEKNNPGKDTLTGRNKSPTPGTDDGKTSEKIIDVRV